ncbi:MAG: hypothetical protein HQK56_17125 [Deltaproteobacteria bacterium]|nr:hypothetical protein [Deltaproteobacteria bacterium]
MSAQVGDRVFAVQKADDEKVYLYGRGVYQGRQEDNELEIPNPKISLDGGGVVWG